MNVHVRLRGVPAKILERAVESGVAESKAEAIRMSLVMFGRELFDKEFKQEFVNETLEILKTQKPKKTTIDSLLGE